MLVGEVIDRYELDKLPQVADPHGLSLRCATLRAFFGEMELSALHDPKHVWGDDGYVAMRKAGRVTWVDVKGAVRGGRKGGDSTTRRELNVLCAAIEHARKVRIITLDQVPYIQKPPESAPRTGWLLRSDAAALLNACQRRTSKRLTRTYVAVALLIFTGARKAAVQWLTWDRVTRVNGQEATGLYGYVDYRDPSLRATKKRRAIVPINQELAQVLDRAYQERNPDSPFVLGHPGDFAPGVEAAYRRAGIIRPKGQLIHVLRKSFATWAAQDRVPMYQIAGALGDTIATTEKAYAIHSPDYMSAIVQRKTVDVAVDSGGLQGFTKPKDPDRWRKYK